MNCKKVIVTGAAGFIGHHLCEHLLRKTAWNLILLDKLTYASGGLKRLKDNGVLSNSRVSLFTVDLSIPLSEGVKKEIGNDVEYIISLASDTHVDNSITSPVPFIKNNIMSTTYLLEYCRTLPKLKKFIYFSTDEIFGSAPKGISYKEWDRMKPTNPYSGSKAGSECLCLAYHNTYKVPITIVNCMNAFGERQHVEKFIPKVINSILKGEMIEIHSDKTCKIPGSRFYIHARNIADAVLFVLEKGEIGEKYNIVGEKEVDNLEMAQFISKVMNKELKYKLVNFHENRPGHDERYALDGSKLLEMGWKLPLNFDQSLTKTIEWTLKHKEWLDWE